MMFCDSLLHYNALTGRLLWNVSTLYGHSQLTKYIADTTRQHDQASLVKQKTRVC